MSPTQRWFGADAVNSRQSTLGAIGWSWLLSVVSLNRLRTRALSPSSCMMRMTRLRPTFLPSSSTRSRSTRGEPYVRRLLSKDITEGDCP